VEKLPAVVTGRIDAIVAAAASRGMHAAPIEDAIALALAHPEAVGALARATMERSPRGGTFLDAALSHIPDEAWGALVADALAALERDPDNAAADTVIAYASLQAPSRLHPHLDRIFRLAPNRDTYYAEYPWRGSGASHLAFLRARLADGGGDSQDRRRAWRAMLETRHPDVLEAAVAGADVLDLGTAHRSAGDALADYVRFVGFEVEGGALRRLCPPALFHVLLPDSHRDPAAPPSLDWTHPTWRLEAAIGLPTMRLGGEAPGTCLSCGDRLDRLLDLDPVPDGLGVTGLRRLGLATCLSCLGWEQQIAFYVHQSDGDANGIGDAHPPVTPEFPAEPLLETEVRLAATPARWSWQDWALSNGRENLHRLGGEPTWIQNADYPACPLCGRTMTHLLQLDSELRTVDGSSWLWGSGGIAYVAWCDSCKVSATQWQCT
jgi:hypothetical protein